MTMRNTTVLLLLAIGLVSACSGSASHTPSGNAFVNDAIVHTSETAEPTQIDNVDLSFSDSETAFSNLFQ